MRLFSRASLLAAVLTLPALISGQDQAPKPDQAQAQVAKQDVSSEPPMAGAAGGDEPVKPTTFNGIEVPPLKELDGEKFDEQIKDGYWFVEHYSPYCHHCKEIAPTWQTLYEYYFTSKPVPSSPQSSDHQASLNSFQKYYNFHFAKLDCIAYGTACDINDIRAFPTFVLFKDGKTVKTFQGPKNLDTLSAFIEESLESIRPGSRSKQGVKLPSVGASKVDTEAKPEKPAAKDKDAAAGVAAGENHKEKVAQAATESVTSKISKETAEASKAQRPAVVAAKPSVTPNELGHSVPLSAEAFQNLVTTTQNPWFIKFYAPWCHHCQAMAANWAELGREMQGKLNIGEVNCDVETRLCKDVRLKGYPTILFFKGGERIEYDGLRGLGDFVNFAKKAIDIGDGVGYVDAAAFKEMEEKEEVIFVYFFDHATTREDFEAIERVQLSLIGHAKIVKTDSEILADRFKITTWPRLLVSRDSRPSYYTALAPKDMRDFRKVLEWMKSVWLPIVPELTASNSREIMENKFVALGILSRERQDDFQVARREIKNAALEWMDKQTQAFQLERQELRDAKQLRIEEAEDRGDQRALRAAKSIKVKMDEADRTEVGFAWVDGIFWERWIKTTYGIDVKDGERVIINDENNRRFWDMTASGGFIVPSRTSILETLPKVVHSPPKLKSKSSTSSLESVYYEVRGASKGHPYVSIGMLIGVLVGLAVWGRARIRRGKSGNGGAGGGGGGAGGIINGSGAGSGFFRLDGKEGLLGGGGQNGKVD